MPKRQDDNSRPVYSTESGRLCPGCGAPAAQCRCREKAKGPAGPKDGVVRIRREVSGRGGKEVTVISGLPLDEKGLETLVKELKKRCGTGGTVKGGNIEIQGEHRDRLSAELTGRGYKVKLAGG